MAGKFCVHQDPPLGDHNTKPVQISCASIKCSLPNPPRPAKVPTAWEQPSESVGGVGSESVGGLGSESVGGVGSESCVGVASSEHSHCLWPSLVAAQGFPEVILLVGTDF